jgi:hypothetical protein
LMTRDPPRLPREEASMDRVSATIDAGLQVRAFGAEWVDLTLERAPRARARAVPT